MNKLLALSVATVLVVFAPAANANVFSFIETACTSNSPLSCITSEFGIGTFSLAEPTSTGSARWTSGPDTMQPPVLTGDTNFSFVDALGFTIAPPTFVPNCRGFEASPFGPCFYDISWSELNGRLESLTISLQNVFYNIGVESFGLTGGAVATDGPNIGGCPESATCEITGFWRQQVPEPMSASLLLSALLGLACGRRYLR